jgi:hypothetical protein
VVWRVLSCAVEEDGLQASCVATNVLESSLRETNRNDLPTFGRTLYGGRGTALARHCRVFRVTKLKNKTSL